jgi:hypothetical protein
MNLTWAISFALCLLSLPTPLCVSTLLFIITYNNTKSMDKDDPCHELQVQMDLSTLFALIVVP